MAMFKGFKPQGLQKIANRMGYTGSLEGFDSYLQQNPDKQNMMNMYNQRAVQMAQGGAVRRFAEGGEFEFFDNNTNLIKEKMGTVIVFPSYMVHRVRPVTKGTRYSLVSWFCGEPFV